MGLIKLLLIPEVSENFQKQIRNIVLHGVSIYKRSLATYNEAENLILNELDLHTWQPTQANTEVKSFKNSFLKTGRLDAEFYQPKYDEYFDKITSACKKKNWALINLRTASEPLKYGSSFPYEYMNEGVPFLRIADLLDFEFDKSSLKYINVKEAEKEMESCKVKTNDVLISRSGSLGLTVVIPEDLNGSVFGSYFIRVRLKSKEINPHYLTLFMNSKAGKIQVEQQNTGGIQTNLTIPVIESFKIPVPDIDIQNLIVETVKQSEEYKQGAGHLLQIAKQAVEKAIEENEEAAMEFIKKMRNYMN